MAQPDIIRGTYFSLMLGDGGGPETFAALCGITTKNFTHQSNSQDVNTRDCADPENVPVRNVIITSQQWDLTGEGVLNRANLEDIQDADDGQPHNWRLVFTEPASDLVYQGYWAGAAIITNLTIVASDENFATISITLASTGEWTFTPV
jgi:predicted secreted protein